jgi:hypothetical protein
MACKMPGVPKKREEKPLKRNAHSKKKKDHFL